MGDLFLVRPELFWALIPLVAIIGGIITKSQRIRAEMSRMRATDDAVAQELRDAVRRLESRVANLERAVMTAESERKYAL